MNMYSVCNTGKRYALTDIAHAKEAINASLQPSRGGKLFLEG